MKLTLRGIIYNVLVGIAGGCLILMGMLMFNAVMGLLVPTAPWIMLVILCFTSLVVGVLARLMQPYHGLGSAIASGVIAALIILYLWLGSKSAAGVSLVFGPSGMLVSVAFSIFGAWIFPLLRKRTITPK